MSIKHNLERVMRELDSFHTSLFGLRGSGLISEKEAKKFHALVKEISWSMDKIPKVNKPGVFLWPFHIMGKRHPDDL